MCSYPQSYPLLCRTSQEGRPKPERSEQARADPVQHSVN